MSLCDNYLTDITDAYDGAEWVYDALYAQHKSWLLANYSMSSFNLTWRTHVALGIANLGSMVELLIDCNENKYHPLRLPYYLEHCIEAKEYELTAKKICEAWAKKDFEGRAITIAFIDRMRQMLWNEPFYVAWAAKPSIPK